MSGLDDNALIKKLKRGQLDKIEFPQIQILGKIRKAQEPNYEWHKSGTKNLN
jgi:hypothetical protein